MANLTEVFVTSTALTQFARSLLAPEDRPGNAMILENLFPYQPITGTEWSITRSLRMFTNAAKFRAFNAGGSQIELPGVEVRTGNMLPMSQFNHLQETDIDAMLAAAEQGTIPAEVLAEIFNGVDEMVTSKRARLEKIRASLLLTATVTAPIDDTGEEITASVSRKASRTRTPTPAWTEDASTPFGDEAAMLDILSREEGLEPSDLVVLCNRSTYSTWRSNAQVREASAAFRTPQDMVDFPDAIRIRESYELPPVRVVGESLASEDTPGTSERVIPDGAWIYAPNQEVGATQWGSTAAAKLVPLAQQGTPIAVSAPGPFAWMTVDVSSEPVSMTVHCSAIAMPAFAWANGTAVLTVSAAGNT